MRLRSENLGINPTIKANFAAPIGGGFFNGSKVSESGIIYNLRHYKPTHELKNMHVPYQPHAYRSLPHYPDKK